ncbi:nitrite reductase small subunit NirD [Pusillimonas sp. SM2304]|uniref:nitrite reductase small subunit NirD n=1 Tax=Pusillimonas sp. SM2304 TaxID=3073241 RepID=UPI0028744E85|nr:nitrite reductase small subunit NirD [Pusillimonas sp. SM2304]MDS1139790.1 nitrite reductase small subunit NirD [Pusillimonas sp. SM2304]
MNASLSAQQWTPVCLVDDIPRLGSRIVHQAGREPIAVFRSSDDHIFAVIDRCPHKGGPLSAGLVHGHAVSCPLHGWNINLEDGQAQAPDQGCAHKIGTRVDAGRVYLDLPD